MGAMWKARMKKKELSLEKWQKMVSKKAARRKYVAFSKILIATILSLFFAVLFLLPTFLTFTNSFMAQSEISSNYGQVFATTDTGGKVFISERVNLKFIPDMVSFSQYNTVLLKSPDYLMKFWNSVILVVPIVIFQLVLATFAAYGFTRYTGRIKEIVFFSYIILMLMPFQVTLVPNFLVTDWLNLLDTRWAIWLPGIVSPFAVFLLTKYMRKIPATYLEAGQIDGAGEWQLFSLIALPLCKGAIGAVAILVFIDYWNMVEQPLILISDSNYHPLSVFLSKIKDAEIGLAFAVATIYMVPPILVFLYGEEYLIEGITYQGGIKG